MICFSKSLGEVMKRFEFTFYLTSTNFLSKNKTKDNEPLNYYVSFH